MSAYLNALREEGTREDLLREVERQWTRATEAETKLTAAPPAPVEGHHKPHSLDPKTPVTHDEAYEIAKRFIDYRFGNDNEVPRASIPVNLERDDDVRLHAYIRQNRRAADALTSLAARLAECERVLLLEQSGLRASACHLGGCQHEAATARAEALEKALALIGELSRNSDKAQYKGIWRTASEIARAALLPKEGESTPAKAEPQP